MKRIHQLALIGVAAAALALGTGSAQAGTPAMHRREAMERARIEQGVRSGRLTRGEAWRLRHGERRIHVMDRRFSRDGHFTRGERFRMNRAMNRESMRIWRLKHNRRNRV